MVIGRAIQRRNDYTASGASLSLWGSLSLDILPKIQLKTIKKPAYSIIRSMKSLCEFFNRRSQTPKMCLTDPSHTLAHRASPIKCKNAKIIKCKNR